MFYFNLKALIQFSYSGTRLIRFLFIQKDWIQDSTNMSEYFQLENKTIMIGKFMFSEFMPRVKDSIFGAINIVEAVSYITNRITFPKR